MTEKVKYNLDFLTKFCCDNNITLLKDYSSEIVNRETRIEGKCLTIDCANNFNKKFRQLCISNAYCSKCTENIRQDKAKETWLEKYGVENPNQSEKVREKSKESCKKKYGVEHQLQSKEVRDKMKETCKKKFGVEYASQSELIKIQKIETCIKNFGVRHPMQSKEVREKSKESCKEKYGVEHNSQSKEVREKRKETSIRNWGVEYAMQSEEIREKSKATCKEKYGVEHNSQSEEVKEKFKKTCLEKYGVENPMQNPEVADKSSKASYSRKDYLLPSGNIVKVQGYEPFALDELVKVLQEDDIKTGSENVPEIWYDRDGQYKRHFVDIFIPSQNKCIEVKSTWTFKKKRDNVLLKQKAGKALGLNYEIWVYNSKGEKDKCYI